MPSVIERFRSRSGTYGESGQIEYAITDVTIGATERATVYALVNAVAPPTMPDGLWRQMPQLDNQGGGVWYASVPYSPYKAPEPGNAEWQLRIGTQTMRVTHSLATISKTAPAGKTAPDFKQAVNVEGDRVGGVDRILPTFSWVETWYLDNSAVTPTYLDTLFQLTGRTNNATWRWFAAGEVLFLGAQGAPANADVCKFDFEFSAEPNLTNIVIGDITVPSKKGHEYLWVLYEPVEDATANWLPQRPRAAYVERIYEAGDYSGLGVLDPWS